MKKHRNQKTCSFGVEKELYDIIQTASKECGKSTFFRQAIILYLKKIKRLPPEYSDKTVNGGDRWTKKLNSSDPQIRAQARATLNKAAANARAGKSAKANNGGIVISGDISGSGIVIGSGNSQKNLPK